MTKEQKQEVINTIVEIFDNLTTDIIDSESHRKLRYRIGNKFNILDSEDSEWIEIESHVLEIIKLLKNDTN